MATFSFDEDIPDDLAPILRSLGNIVNVTREMGRKCTDDYQQVWFAAARGWVIVTRNGKDFAPLHRAWHLWGVPRSHAGIVIVPQTERARYPALAQALHDLLADPVAFFGQMLAAGRTAQPLRVGRSLGDGLVRLDADGNWTFFPTER